MNILICEDDRMMQKTIEFKLVKDGHTITTAIDGKIASEYIESNEYDLIITDMLMPYKSGLELINLIRSDLKKDTPIIVLSKVGQEETVMEALEMGADDYITKPFSPNELSIRIKKLLLRR